MLSYIVFSPGQQGALSRNETCTSTSRTVITSAWYQTPPGCNAQCKPADSSVKPAECKWKDGNCLQIISAENMLKLYDLCNSEESNDECREFHERIVARLECLDGPIIDPCVEVVKEGTLKVNLLHVWKRNENRIHCTCSITSTLQQGATFNITGLNLYNDARNNAHLKVLGNSTPIILPQLVVPSSPISKRGKHLSALFDVRETRTTSVVRQLLTIRSTDVFLVSCRPAPGTATGKPSGPPTPSPSSAGSETTDVTIASTSSVVEQHTTSLPAAPAAGIDRPAEEHTLNQSTWVIIGFVGGAVVVALVVVAVVVYIRVKNRQIYEGPLPRRQREITVYTGLVPEALRDRELTSIRNTAAGTSQLYSEIDERNIPNAIPDHRQEADHTEIIAPLTATHDNQSDDYLHPTATPSGRGRNQSDGPSHSGTKPVDDIETDSDGYLCPFPRRP
ncbi:hypothetical protein BaRGS_00038564 [Batillaria attramentaria]|uniref:Uncharacterized protein n=1 Tax=Batillaria attramentaria TaxID=370345 RepID=A0ABD0J6I1_9CAEN